VSRTNSLYDVCRGLFETYPQAARAIDARGSVWSIVIMLEDGPNAGYFVLTQRCNKGEPVFSLWSWPDGDVVDIVHDCADPPSALLGDVLSHGVPIPRDGSVFGWTVGGAVAALIVIYVESAVDFGEPGWAVMPRVGMPREDWPPFTGERLFGHWSWERSWSRRIVSLDEVIGGTSETFWWVDTKAVIGSDCCVISTDIVSQGLTVPRGRYAFYEALCSSEAIPPLEALLDDPGKIDLAPRFQIYLASRAVAGGCRN
jgi:hypothetical protein